MNAAAEIKHVRKALRSLVAVCADVIGHLDAEMKQPSTVERGKRIAKITNHLEINKDIAERFGLNYKKS